MPQLQVRTAEEIELALAELEARLANSRGAGASAVLHARASQLHWVLGHGDPLRGELMSEYIDPSTLRPGDVVDMVDTCVQTTRVAVKQIERDEEGRSPVVLAAAGRAYTLDGSRNPSVADRKWRLVSRAEPERGSLWRRRIVGEGDRFGRPGLYYYEPDERWPTRAWVYKDSGFRCRFDHEMVPAEETP